MRCILAGDQKDAKLRDKGLEFRFSDRQALRSLLPLILGLPLLAREPQLLDGKVRGGKLSLPAYGCSIIELD